MASGEPVTSISTAPQKQLPEWVMEVPPFRLPLCFASIQTKSEVPVLLILSFDHLTKLGALLRIVLHRNQTCHVDEVKTMVRAQCLFTENRRRYDRAAVDGPRSPPREAGASTAKT